MFTEWKPGISKNSGNTGVAHSQIITLAYARVVCTCGVLGASY